MFHARPDYESVIDTSGRIPEDEPVFLLRGQDAFAHQAVRYWADHVAAAGGDPELVRRAREQAELMALYPKKKLPDLPPELQAQTESEEQQEDDSAAEALGVAAAGLSLAGDLTAATLIGTGSAPEDLTASTLIGASSVSGDGGEFGGAGASDTYSDTSFSSDASSGTVD